MELQLAIVLILVILTANIVAVGVYLVITLKELRETIKKANHVLDNVGNVTDSIIEPFHVLSTIAAGIASGLKVFTEIKNFKHSGKEE